MIYHKVGDTHWGDSAKGKLINLLIRLGIIRNLKVVSRFNGGPNAGHTVINGDLNAKLHGLPSSILNVELWSLIAQGCVVDGDNLLDVEIPDVGKLGVGFGKLRIAREAFTVLPWHKLIERLDAEALGKTNRDTTMRGIGPAYSDAVGRYGILVGDLLDPDVLKTKVHENLILKNRIPGIAAQGWQCDQVTDQLLLLGERLRPYIVEMDAFLEHVAGPDDAVLLEGAQGAGLDREAPGYPYVTSSGLTTHDAAKIFRIRPEEWGYIFGVCKAYSTSVGRRAFPTHQQGEVGDRIARRGNEVGTTTGRNRDCGWFDAVMLRHAVRVDMITHLFVTKLDVLDEEPELKICVAYEHDGQDRQYPPRIGMNGWQARYETLPGWQQSTRGITKLEDLPRNARKYVDRITELAEVPLAGISTGPDTDESIWLLR